MKQKPTPKGKLAQAAAPTKVTESFQSPTEQSKQALPIPETPDEKARTEKEIQAFVEKHGVRSLTASMKLFEILDEIDEDRRVDLLAHIELVRDGEEETDPNSARLFGEDIIRQRYASLFGRTGV